MTLTTCTYLIEAKSGEIKIGRSTMPHERVKEIAMRSPCEVRLIAFWPSRFDEENDLHQRFAQYRVYREWFTPVFELAEFVEQMRGHGVSEITPWGSSYSENAETRKLIRAQRHSASMRARSAAKQERAA